MKENVAKVAGTVVGVGITIGAFKLFLHELGATLGATITSGGVSLCLGGVIGISTYLLAKSFMSDKNKEEDK